MTKKLFSVTFVAGLLVALALAASANAASGYFDRAWGKNVNGGSGPICTVAANCVIGSTGSAAAEMNFPTGVAADQFGGVWVADQANNRILKYDSLGNFTIAFGKNVKVGGGNACQPASFDTCQAGSTGGLGGEFNQPYGVTTDAAGNVYVSDESNSRIQKLNSSGTFISMFGKGVNATTAGDVCTAASGNTCQAGAVGGVNGQMNDPTGIAVSPVSGDIYVGDRDNNRILRFDSSGTFVSTWGRAVNTVTFANLCTAASGNPCTVGLSASKGGEFNNPQGVATDPAGNVYVADMLNHRIQRFDSAGTFARTWGKDVNGGGGFETCTTAASCQTGSNATAGGGDMSFPFGVAVDADNKVYVADTSNNRIQRFDTSGTFERTWGKGVNMTTSGNLCTAASGNTCQTGDSSSAPGGAMNFPDTVGAGPAGNVYVADTSNHRIQKFGRAQTTLSTVAASATIGSPISDQATLSSPETLGGTVTFKAYGPNDATCANPAAYMSNPVAVSGNGNYNNSPAFTPTSPGTYRWIADYSGDTESAAITGVCGAAMETSTVSQATPTLTTQATASVNLGQSISDQATLAGGVSPGGSITFTVYGPNNATCTGSPAYTSNAVPVSGNGNYNNAPTFTPSSAGTYRWVASYSGDTDNAAISGTCNDAGEASVVKATPTLTTQATASVNLGQSISDQATIAGGVSPGGSITFTAYGPNNATCTGLAAYTSSAVPVAGNGDYNNAPTFTPSSAGTYRWVASYSGDTNNAATSGVCNDANEATVVSNPPAPPSGGGASSPTLAPPPAVTGQRAAALKKCKKKKGAKRKKCKKKANRLPV